MNREEWLTQLAKAHLWPLLKAHKAREPRRWRVSVGFPKGSRGGKAGHAIAQCWAKEASGDGHVEIFVSPELDAETAVHALLHELIHAALPGVGHSGKFRDMAHAVGLTGRMRATVPTEALRAKIAGMLRSMPPYPHAPLAVPEGKKAGPGSRLIKVFCPDCGYTLRTTRQWLDVGVPACPNEVECGSYGQAMMVDG